MKINTIIITLLISLGLHGCATTKSASKQKAADYYTQLGIGYLQRDRLELAKENLEKALQRDRRSPHTQHYYALLQERLGNDRLAADYFTRAMRSDGENPELLNNYGSFLCKHNQIEQAEAIFLRAASDPLYKTPEFAYANAGICLKKRGNTHKAKSYLKKALSIRSDFPSALYHMAELSHKQNENAKAQAFLYRYNERTSHTADSLLLCYRINKALQDAAQAEQCSSQLLAQFPNSQEVGLLN